MLQAVQIKEDWIKMSVLTALQPLGATSADVKLPYFSVQLRNSEDIPELQLVAACFIKWNLKSCTNIQAFNLH